MVPINVKHVSIWSDSDSFPGNTSQRAIHQAIHHFSAFYPGSIPGKGSLLGNKLLYGSEKRIHTTLSPWGALLWRGRDKGGKSQIL